MPFVVALAVTFAVMVLLGIAIERLVLRPLVNKPPITLFMATLGLAYIIEGAAQLMWGTQVHGLDLGIEDVPFDVGGVLISKFDLFAAGVAATMVAVLTAFFQLHPRRPQLPGSRRRPVFGTGGRTATVAHLGHRLECGGLRRPWSPACSGARDRVCSSLCRLSVLKALPVLVLGGFNSILGAIVGGLLVGATEKLAEVYIGPFVGGGIETWFAYAAALAFLLVRPSGLFGQTQVERV